MMTFDVAQLLIFGIVCGAAGYSFGSWANERVTRLWDEQRRQCEALLRDAAATYANAQRLLEQADAER